ncbi:Autophagy-related 29 [Apiospora saccharicola]
MASPQPEPTYTVFIRLPFARGDFVDPPPVNWDSSKDEALWNIISEVAKTEIDWNDIATRFQVTVDFLLQQVAFLTERHASQVRAQMRKAAAVARSSAAPSPVPGTDPPTTAVDAVQQQQQMGSALGRPRAPSALSIRRDSPLPRNDTSVPGTPMRATPRPQSIRTSSSNTAVYTTRNLGSSSKGAARQPPADNLARKRLSSLPITTSVDDDDDDPEPDPPSPGPAETSSAESSSSESSPAQSRIIRRPPRFQSNDGPSFADDEEEDEPAFLPYRKQADASSSAGNNDLTATLKGNPATADLSNRRVPQSHHHRIHQSQTSDSSAGSATPAGKGSSADKGRPSGPLSPRRTMELAGRSPSGKGKGYSRDSDETPSMGSSFSDLDDASVTQSALEEALASKMQDGGTIGSRMSTFSNVFRSRYLPKTNN